VIKTYVKRAVVIKKLQD